MSWILRFNHWLSGWPDKSLTVLLIILAAIGVVVAFWGPPALKAGLAAYWLLP